MRFFRLVSIVILLSTIITTTFGQDVQIQKSTEKIRVEGNVYYVHNVKKGETIYSLTKVYGISEDELARTNPELSDGLKEGQVLQIPENPAGQSTQQKVVQDINGMIKHEVQRKETLSSISRQYNISVDAIKKANPTIDDNIKKGQIIYIPAALNNMQTNSSDSNQSSNNNTNAEYVYHSVKKGETLFSITQQYKVSESSIKAINPDAFKDGVLMDGAVLRVPKLGSNDLESGIKVLHPDGTYQYGSTSTPPPTNSYTYSNTDIFNVVFLIPLSSSASTNLGLSENTSKKQSHNLEFYEGALLAIDTLKQAGLSLNISTFDIPNEQSLSTALQNSSVQQAHLIIAPVQTELAQQLTYFAQQKQIPVVLPTSNLSDSLISYNPHIVELRTSSSCLNSKLLNNICKDNSNIVLVQHYGKDTTLLHTYKSILKAKGCTYSTLNYTIARSRSDLQLKLSSTKENHVIVASDNDQPFVMNVLETLNILQTKDKIKSNIYGTPGWRKMSMNSLQVGYLYNLNLHLAQPFFVDYNAIETKRFLAEYRFYYKSEPSNYAFYGYDVCLYFLNCLKTYGRNFMPYLPSNGKSMLQSHFSFKQIGSGGMKNEGVFLLEYQPDLNIIRK